MKRAVGVGVVMLFSAACSVAWASTVTRIIAVVNDEVITNADLTEEIQQLLQDRDGQLPQGMTQDQLQRMVLTRLIERSLLLQEAKRQNISVTAEDVADRVDMLRRRHPSDEAFDEALAASGLTEERLKEQIRDQLLVSDLVDQKVRVGIVVSPQEVAKELQAHPEEQKPGDRILARHLLIRANETRSDDAAKQLIDQLRGEIAGGAPFAEVATKHSEDPSATDGGLMEWMAQGDLLPELDQALFALQPGQMSEPVHSKLGWHLLIVEERKPASSLSPADANAAIHERLFQEKFQQAFTRWIGELKRKAYIEVLDHGA